MSATANALNAQLSTGPTTAAGKEISKFNAVKSGLFAQTVVLPSEDRDAYEVLGDMLHSVWSPVNDNERQLVLTIQNSKWRLQRAIDLEYGLLAIGTAEHREAIDQQFSNLTPLSREALAKAAAYRANLKAIDQANRQENRLRRLVERTERELSQTILNRSFQLTPAPQPAAAPKPAGPAPETTAPATTAPPTGFVPPQYPDHMPVFEGKGQRRKRHQWLRQNGLTHLIK